MTVKIFLKNGSNSFPDLFPNSEVVPFENAPLDSERMTKTIDWKIYLFYKMDLDQTALSIILTREGTFVMNHLTVYSIEEETDVINSKIKDAFALVSKVLQDKIVNKHASSISPDKSTLRID